MNTNLESINFIYSFRKNNHQEVRAFFNDFHGCEMAHIRVFEIGGLYQFPTTKGISVVATQLHELKRAVDALVSAQEGNLQ